MGELIRALSISGTALIIAFAVLILIMLAMYASAAIFSRQKAPAAATPQSVATPTVPSRPVIHADQADEEHVAAIVAALEAAEVTIPAGGRIRIEKVSRRSQRN